MKGKEKKTRGASAAEGKRQREAGNGPPSARPLASRDGDGRLRLALYRDPHSGEELLALRSPLFREDWQNQLVAGAANTARAAVGPVPTAESLGELARAVMGSVSRLTEGLLAQAPAGAVACRAGCDHCCYQAVSVTLPEALVIRQHLQATRAPEERAQLRAHVVAAHERTRGLSPAERFSPQHPCPFLVVSEGRCSIYEVRPLACRGMNSLDAEECSRRLREPAARAAFLATGAGSHSFLEPIRAVHAVSAGLQLALAELRGLDMRPLDLTAIAASLLDEDQADEAVAAWLAGGKPFEAAVRPSTASDPTLRAISGALPG